MGGYLENWGPDIKWWDENMPGNCLMGCFKAQPLIEQIAPYSSINYGFAFLTTLPDPDQDGCGTVAPAGPCPVWDGENIYRAKAAKLMAKFVAYTFAQGVDIDMEHLSPFTNNFDDADEFEALNAFVDQLRTEFDTVSANWYDNA